MLPPIEPVERYLAYLTDIERSPNTVKAYAHDLKDWFSFLELRAKDWREVQLEDIGEFDQRFAVVAPRPQHRVPADAEVAGHSGDCLVMLPDPPHHPPAGPFGEHRRPRQLRVRLRPGPLPTARLRAAP